MWVTTTARETPLWNNIPKVVNVRVLAWRSEFWLLTSAALTIASQRHERNLKHYTVNAVNRLSFNRLQTGHAQLIIPWT